MTDATVPAPRRGWWWLGLAVLVFMIAADLPVAQTLLPVHRPLLLLLPSLAACALVGWWNGGSALRAVGAVGLAAWPVWAAARGRPALAGGGCQSAQGVEATVEPVLPGPVDRAAQDHGAGPVDETPG